VGGAGGQARRHCAASGTRSGGWPRAVLDLPGVIEHVPGGSPHEVAGRPQDARPRGPFGRLTARPGGEHRQDRCPRVIRGRPRPELRQVGDLCVGDVRHDRGELAAAAARPRAEHFPNGPRGRASCGRPATSCGEPPGTCSITRGRSRTARGLPPDRVPLAAQCLRACPPALPTGPLKRSALQPKPFGKDLPGRPGPWTQQNCFATRWSGGRATST
jgi:hypothetical protein